MSQPTCVMKPSAPARSFFAIFKYWFIDSSSRYLNGETAAATNIVGDTARAWATMLTES